MHLLELKKINCKICPHKSFFTGTTAVLKRCRLNQYGTPTEWNCWIIYKHCFCRFVTTQNVKNVHFFYVLMLPHWRRPIFECFISIKCCSAFPVEPKKNLLWKTKRQHEICDERKSGGGNYSKKKLNEGAKNGKMMLLNILHTSPIPLLEGGTRKGRHY